MYAPIEMGVAAGGRSAAESAQPGLDKRVGRQSNKHDDNCESEHRGQSHQCEELGSSGKHCYDGRQTGSDHHGRAQQRQAVAPDQRTIPSH